MLWPPVELNQVQGQDLTFLGANQHGFDLHGLGPGVGGAQQRFSIHALLAESDDF